MLRKGTCLLQEFVDHCGLAVVNVSNDCNIAQCAHKKLL